MYSRHRSNDESFVFSQVRNDLDRTERLLESYISDTSLHQHHKQSDSSPSYYHDDLESLTTEQLCDINPDDLMPSIKESPRIYISTPLELSKSCEERGSQTDLSIQSHMNVNKSGAKTQTHIMRKDVSDKPMRSASTPPDIKPQKKLEFGGVHSASTYSKSSSTISTSHRKSLTSTPTKGGQVVTELARPTSSYTHSPLSSITSSPVKPVTSSYEDLYVKRRSTGLEDEVENMRVEKIVEKMECMNDTFRALRNSRDRLDTLFDTNNIVGSVNKTVRGNKYDLRRADNDQGSCHENKWLTDSTSKRISTQTNYVSALKSKSSSDINKTSAEVTKKQVKLVSPSPPTSTRMNLLVERKDTRNHVRVTNSSTNKGEASGASKSYRTTLPIHRGRQPVMKPSADVGVNDRATNKSFARLDDSYNELYDHLELCADNMLTLVRSQEKAVASMVAPHCTRTVPQVSPQILPQYRRYNTDINQLLRLRRMLSKMKLVTSQLDAFNRSI